MNKKIGILTLNGFRNYGNVLQNYSLQKYFESLGYAPETLWYVDLEVAPGVSFIEKVKYRIQRKTIFRALINHLKIAVNPTLKTKMRLVKMRESTFQEFADSHITYASTTIDDSLLVDVNQQERLDHEYLTFFSGSDQVWGISDNKFPAMYFLPFADRSKRNSFSASFGFSELPDHKFESSYQQGLTLMHKISVREYEGKELVEKMVDRRDTTVLLDPTLLLSRSQWELVANSKMCPEGDYILTYFIGSYDNNRSTIVQRFSVQGGLKVINLNDFADENLYAASPSDFVGLFQKAKYVVTDSFHGAVFALIFQKKFIVLPRVDNMVNMNSRLSTLLEHAGLQDKLFIKDDFGSFAQVLQSDIDFSTFENAVRDNEIKTLKFVREALMLS